MIELESIGADALCAEVGDDIRAVSLCMGKQIVSAPAGERVVAQRAPQNVISGPAHNAVRRRGAGERKRRSRRKCDTAVA
jgi:hypothetical protein